MSTETIAILRAVCDQIDDAIGQAKKTIEPKVLAREEMDWRKPDHRTYEGPQEDDRKREVVKFWPQLVPLANLHRRVQQYMLDVQGQQNGSR